MNKLYTITRRGLGAGAQIAQSCHAVAAFAAHHPDEFRSWALPEQRNIVCLEADALDSLLANLSAAGIKCAAFHETDLGNELTAIACEETAARYLSSLPLAGKVAKQAA